MSDSYRLDDFLYAIKASIYEANRKAWRHHLLNLQRYFKVDRNRVWHPRMLTMMLPSPQVSEGQPEVERTEIPIASLVEHSPLTMSNLSMEFECYIEGLHGREGGKPQNQSVILLMTSEKKALPRAKLSIEYKTDEDPPEGIARINDALLKYF